MEMDFKQKYLQRPISIGQYEGRIILWDVTPCNLLDTYRSFKVPCCLHDHPFWCWKQQYFPKGFYVLIQLYGMPNQKPMAIYINGNLFYRLKYYGYISSNLWNCTSLAI